MIQFERIYLKLSFFLWQVSTWLTSSTLMLLTRIREVLSLTNGGTRWTTSSESSPSSSNPTTVCACLSGSYLSHSINQLLPLHVNISRSFEADILLQFFQNIFPSWNTYRTTWNRFGILKNFKSLWRMIITSK